MKVQDLCWWRIDDGGISPSFVPSAYDDLDSETAKEVRDELSEAINRMECDHDFADRKKSRTDSTGEHEWHVRDCTQCSMKEGEWRHEKD